MEQLLLITLGDRRERKEGRKEGSPDLMWHSSLNIPHPIWHPWSYLNVKIGRGMSFWLCSWMTIGQAYYFRPVLSALYYSFSSGSNVLRKKLLCSKTQTCIYCFCKDSSSQECRHLGKMSSIFSILNVTELDFCLKQQQQHKKNHVNVTSCLITKSNLVDSSI